MPTDNFIPTSASSVADAMSLSAFGGLLLSWSNANLADSEDGSPATIAWSTGGSVTTYYTNSVIVTNFVREATGFPIATAIPAGSTINSLFVQHLLYRAPTSGPTGNTFASLVSHQTGTSVGTRGSASLSSLSTTPTWISVTNGTVFGGSATIDDIRGTGFGCYAGLVGTTGGTVTVSLDAIRVVIDWTEPAASATTVRRQNVRLPDGRVAAVRARIR